ncbi:MAG: futalosine hydrolase [Desulfobacteraceae bacterium]|nr:futalosine hydrolase [Desulfobacteraceae bacterium]MBC2719400.1 futalosine hydrolase [Desulfobacteraceae bacterium]
MINSDIIVLAAVEEELSKLIDRIENPIFSIVGGRRITCGYIEGKPVRVLITGPGTVNTVQSLTAAIENARPSLIIQSGCAGAFRESGLNIGDIGIATEEIDIQLGIEAEDSRLPLNELPFSIIKSSNIDIKNRYPLDIKLVNQASETLTKVFEGKSVQVVNGSFVTVSTITATDSRAKDIYKYYSSCMEGMEGAGTAHLAIHYDIPFLEIRSASNFVGKRDRSSWNLSLAFERGAMAVLNLIHDFLSEAL